MTKKIFSLCLIALFLAVSIGFAEETIPVTKANYKLPARFTPNKMRTMVFSTYVDAHWLKNSDRFWYIYETSEGKSFNIVDPARKTKRPIFDNVKMAAMLTKMTKDPYEAKHLPIDRIKFKQNDKIIYFKVPKNKDVLDAEKREEKRLKKEEKKDEEKKEEIKKKGKDEEEEEKSAVEKAKEEAQKFHHFEYEIATGKLTLLEDFVDKPERPRWASISPDGNTIVFGRQFNLYYMDKENYEKWQKNPKDETIEEVQLTTDGEEHYSYHRGGRGETNVDKEKNKDKRKSAFLIWSQDSKKFAMSRADEREVKDPERQLKTETETEWSLSVLLANFLGFRTPAVQSHRKQLQDNVGPASHSDNVAELLDKIDQGYIVEETGERAYIPRFARAWLQSSISSADWV